MVNYGGKRCHILIYEAWIGPRIPGMQIDHLNGNVLDYRARNLEQISPKENIRRSKRLQALRKMGMRTNDMPPEVAKNFFNMKEIDFQFFVNNFRVEAQDTNMDRDFTRHREF